MIAHRTAAVIVGLGPCLFAAACLSNGGPARSADKTEARNPQSASAPQAKRHLPILPGGHQGFGMQTPAGSGRHLDVPRTQIIRVTNLKASGPGSLKAALDTEGPRTIIFEVSGNIDLRPCGTLAIRHPYVTVAGQTAPPPGITIVGGQIVMSNKTHDVLIQHIRVRVGDLLDPTRPKIDPKSGWSQWSERDNIKIGGRQVVIDHCSFSWATDENGQSRASEMTFQHCISSECLASPKHHKGPHSKGLLMLNQGPGEGQNLLAYGNLFAYNWDRNPTISSGTRAAIINTYVFGGHHEGRRHARFCHTVSNAPPKPRHPGNPGHTIASIIGTHADNVSTIVRLIARERARDGQIYMADFLWTNRDRDGQPITHHHADGWESPHNSLYKEWAGKPCDPQNSRVAEPPVVVEGLKIRPVQEVRDWVLKTAGAFPAMRGPVDARVIEQVRNRTGHIIASQNDVGGWPDLQEKRRELVIPEDPHGDADGDGYTNLEEWLHEYAAVVEGRAG